MKHLSKQATSIFNKCIQGFKELGDHRRIGDADTGFMPLIIECVDTWGLGLIYSLAHYAEQNSDLMRDPEMTFLVGKDSQVFPLTYRNDFVGVDQVAAEPNDKGDGVRFNARLQAQLCTFATQWLKNIDEQQNL